MPKPYVTICHNSFARQSVIRRVVKVQPGRTCDLCGQVHVSPRGNRQHWLFQYGVETDGGRVYWQHRLFCSIGYSAPSAACAPITADISFLPQGQTMKIILPSPKAMEAEFGEKTGLTAKDFRRKLAALKIMSKIRPHNYGADEWSLLDKEYPATARWVAGCYGTPTFHAIAMEAFSEMTKGFGHERIDSSETKARTDLYYVNHGDPYVGTIMRYADSGRFFIGCWGDKVK
jgi:hypothetical protein